MEYHQGNTVKLHFIVTCLTILMYYEKQHCHETLRKIDAGVFI